MLRTIVVSIGIIASVLAASAAQLTPEVPVSSPVYGQAPGDQTGPVVGTDGSEFLVAWKDYRGAPGAIYATRTARNGLPLDGTGIRIDFPFGANDTLLGCFYIDGAYTILYSYEAVLQPPDSRVAAARISDDGKVLEPMHDVYEGDSVIAAAANGSTIVLMSGAHFVALNDRNEVVGTYAIPTGAAYGGNIASNGTTFLAMAFTWDGHSNTVDFIALDSGGAPTVSKYVQTSATGTPAVMASDGDGYLALYEDPSIGSAVIRHMDATGTTIKAARSALYTAFVWTGQSYLATALTGDVSKPQLAAVQLDRDGTPIGETVSLSNAAGGFPTSSSAASNGRETLLTWTTGRQDLPYGFDVLGAVASPDGTLLSPPHPISQTSNAQKAVAAATSGLQDLVVWTEPGGVYAARLNARAEALDGRGFAITTGTTPWEIDATWDGTAYIVGWAGPDGLKVQRVDTTGALVGSAVDIASCSGSFALAADDQSAVVFYRLCSDRPIVAQRLGPAGPSGAPVPVTSDGDYPRASWNGSEWLLAWNVLIPIPGLLVSPPPTRGEVFARRLSSSFTPLDPEIPIAISDYDSDGPPLVANDGRDFLMTWSHFSYTSGNGVEIRKLHADGTLDETELLVSGSLAPWSVAWRNNDYAIAYGTWMPYANRDLFLTHVRSHDRVTISATPTDEANAALIATLNRPLRIVYTRVAGEPIYGGVARVFMRDTIDGTRLRPVRGR